MGRPLGLNTRQREVRKQLIRNNGIVNNAALAEQFDCSRQQIWRDRQIIQKLRPIPADEWDEDAEIGAAKARFNDLETRLNEELEDLEGQIAARTGHKSVTGLYSCRTNLLRECRAVETDRNGFLITIGYIKAAPQRIDVRRDLADLKGPALEDEIVRLQHLQSGAVDGPDGS